VPNTIRCEACFQSLHSSRGHTTVHSPDVVDVPSTSHSHPNTPPADMDDENTNVLDTISEASTPRMDDNNDLFINYAAIYDDKYYTFWIHERHLGRRWKKKLTSILAFLPSLVYSDTPNTYIFYYICTSTQTLQLLPCRKYSQSYTPIAQPCSMLI
jgi:hypothetical protein